VPPSCKSRVTALAANVAVSPLFLNLYLLPPSETTTTLYVCVGDAPPASQFQETRELLLPLVPAFEPSVNPSESKEVTFVESV